MKTSKIAIGGAAAVALYLLLRKSDPSAAGSITVVKTSGECDPSSSHYDVDACAADGDINAPASPPMVRSAPGSDGPATRPLQIVNGIGIRSVYTPSIATFSTRIGH